MKETTSNTALIQVCEELLKRVRDWEPDGWIGSKTEEEANLKDAWAKVHQEVGALAGRLVQGLPLETVSPQLLTFVGGEAAHREQQRRRASQAAVRQDPTLTWAADYGTSPLVPPGMLDQFNEFKRQEGLAKAAAPEGSVQAPGRNDDGMGR